MSGRVITSSSVGPNTGLDATTQPSVTSTGVAASVSDGGVVPAATGTSSTGTAAASEVSYNARVADEELARGLYDLGQAGLPGLLASTPSLARGLDTLTGGFGTTSLLTAAINAIIAELELTQRVFNVKTYGAVGDGTTDDTAAIQAAEAAAYAAGGGIVDFPIPSVGYLITSSITFHSRIIFRGHSKGFSAGSRVIVRGTIAGFKSYNPATVVRDIAFEDMTIDNEAASDTGKFAIDLLGVSFFRIHRISGRNHDAGLRMGEGGGGSGYYAEVEGCEWASCWYGEYLQAAANAIRIIGGRRQGCETGVYTEDCTGNLIDVTCEGCDTGVNISGGSSGIEVNGYYEGNLYGAIICDANSSRNIIRPRLLSNGTDFVRNDGESSNVFFGHYQPAFPAMETGAGSGKQILTWGGLNVDANSDGLADGLAMDPSIPAGTTLVLDSVTRRTASACQRYGWNATSSRRIQGSGRTAVGQRYTLHGYVRTTLGGVMRLFAGESTINHTTYSGPIMLGTAPSRVDHWEYFCFSFVATQEEMVCGLELVDPSGSGFAWMADWKLEAGVVPTSFSAYEDGNVIGAPLASGSTIGVTHRIHKVTGTATIDSIVTPFGFAGEVIFIPTGAWSTTSVGGNIANAITATANQPVRAVFDPSTAKWYFR